MIPLTIFAASEDGFVGIKYYITITGTGWTLAGAGSVNYTVDWGDGNTETSTTNYLSHTYASAGSYVVAVTPTGTYRPYWNNSTDADRITVCEISTDPTWSPGSNLQDAFEGAAYMTTITMNFSATSNVTSLFRAWEDCYDLTSFPLIDTSNVTIFGEAWESNRDLTSFPLIDTSSGTYFYRTWYGCSNLTSFPANMFDSTGGLSSSNAFYGAWYGCALTAQSIENILTSLDTNGQSNLFTHMSGGTSAAKSTWSTAANTAYTNLINKGWTISHNT